MPSQDDLVTVSRLYCKVFEQIMRHDPGLKDPDVGVYLAQADRILGEGGSNGGGGSGGGGSTGTGLPSWTWLGTVANYTDVGPGQMGLYAMGGKDYLFVGPTDLSGAPNYDFGALVKGDSILLRSPDPIVRYMLTDAVRTIGSAYYAPVARVGWAGSGALDELPVSAPVTMDVSLAAAGSVPAITTVPMGETLQTPAAMNATPWVSPRQWQNSFNAGPITVLAIVDLDYPAGFNDPGNVTLSIAGFPDGPTEVGLYTTFAPLALPLSAAVRQRAMASPWISPLPSGDYITVVSSFDYRYGNVADAGVKLAGYSLVFLQNANL